MVCEKPLFYRSNNQFDLWWGSLYQCLGRFLLWVQGSWTSLFHSSKKYSDHDHFCNTPTSWTHSPLSSFVDLEFVLHNWKSGDPPLPKFLVFFDDINEAICVCNHIWSLVPPEFCDKIKWFNSDISNVFKDSEATWFGGDDRWGLFTTDLFGMVSQYDYILYI